MLDLVIPKGIEFFCKNITLDMIPEIKKIIYDEWWKSGFQTDGICEIEYYVPHKKERYDFYYFVSIK